MELGLDSTSRTDPFQTVRFAARNDWDNVREKIMTKAMSSVKLSSEILRVFIMTIYKQQKRKLWDAYNR